MVFGNLTFVPVDMDADGGYIRMNTTKASMESIDGLVSTLNDVPGFRLTATYAPTELVPDSFRINTAGTGYTSFNVMLSLAGEIGSALNVSKSIGDYNSNYAYVGSVAEMFYDIIPPSNLFAIFSTTEGVDFRLRTLTTRQAIGSI